MTETFNLVVTRGQARLLSRVSRKVCPIRCGKLLSNRLSLTSARRTTVCLLLDGVMFLGTRVKVLRQVCLRLR